MSEIKAEIGDFQRIEDLCMDKFELTESLWNELSEIVKKTLIKVYMNEKRAGSAGQPDQDRFCEYKEIREGRLVECDHPSGYRVSLYSNIDILNDDDVWEKERREEYLCENHFKRKYFYNEYQPSKDIGIFSYKTFKTKINKEEIELRIKARK